MVSPACAHQDRGKKASRRASRCRDGCAGRRPQCPERKSLRLSSRDKSGLRPQATHAHRELDVVARCVVRQAAVVRHRRARAAAANVLRVLHTPAQRVVFMLRRARVVQFSRSCRPPASLLKVLRQGGPFGALWLVDEGPILCRGKSIRQSHRERQETASRPQDGLSHSRSLRKEF